MITNLISYRQDESISISLLLLCQDQRQFHPYQMSFISNISTASQQSLIKPFSLIEWKADPYIKQWFVDRVKAIGCEPTKLEWSRILSSLRNHLRAIRDPNVIADEKIEICNRCYSMKELVQLPCYVHFVCDSCFDDVYINDRHIRQSCKICITPKIVQAPLKRIFQEEPIDWQLIQNNLNKFKDQERNFFDRKEARDYTIMRLHQSLSDFRHNGNELCEYHRLHQKDKVCVTCQTTFSASCSGGTHKKHLTLGKLQMPQGLRPHLLDETQKCLKGFIKMRNETKMLRVELDSLQKQSDKNEQDLSLLFQKIQHQMQNKRQVIIRQREYFLNAKAQDINQFLVKITTALTLFHENVKGPQEITDFKKALHALSMMKIISTRLTCALEFISNLRNSAKNKQNDWSLEDIERELLQFSEQLAKFRARSAMH